jgi:hypothetical protein
MPLVLERWTPAQWPALAPFIHAWNQRADGGIHCVHAASGADVASHAAELAALAPDEAAFWGVMLDGRLVGAVGCEFDASVGRAWGARPARRRRRRARRVAAARRHDPGGRVARDSDPSTDFPPPTAPDSTTGIAPRATCRSRSTPRCASSSARLRRRPGEAGPAVPSDLPTVLGLHAELFPSPYLGDEAFRRALNATDCALFVARGVEAEPLGYLYVEDRPAEQEVYVHYLGVIESARGQGLGKALLGRAARWGVDRGRSGMALNRP